MPAIVIATPQIDVDCQNGFLSIPPLWFRPPYLTKRLHAPSKRSTTAGNCYCSVEHPTESARFVKATVKAPRPRPNLFSLAAELRDAAAERRDLKTPDRCSRRRPGLRPGSSAVR